MTVTTTRTAPIEQNHSAGLSALRYDRLVDVVVGIPGAEIVEHLEPGSLHPKVRFTVPARIGHQPLEVLLGERLLVVGSTRLNNADFVGAPVASVRVTVMTQILHHVLTDAVRARFGGYRTATGARAVDGQLWTSAVRPTEAGGAVGVSLIDPSTGRHLHLEVERTGITLRTDSRTATTPASVPATRAHLERVAEAYGRTHAELVSDLHVFAGTVLDHPAMRLVVEVTGAH